MAIFVRMEFVVAALLIVYLVPFTVAAAREHPRVNWILGINLLLGWTAVGWGIALAWSRSRPNGLISRHWPWLHPEPPGRRARRRLRLVSGGADPEAVDDRRASCSQTSGPRPAMKPPESDSGGACRAGSCRSREGEIDEGAQARRRSVAP